MDKEIRFDTLNSSVVIIPSLIRKSERERERYVKSCFESTCSSFMSKTNWRKNPPCGALKCVSRNWKAMLWPSALHHNSESQKSVRFVFVRSFRLLPTFHSNKMMWKNLNFSSRCCFFFLYKLYQSQPNPKALPRDSSWCAEIRPA